MNSFTFSLLDPIYIRYSTVACILVLSSLVFCLKVLLKEQMNPYTGHKSSVYIQLCTISRICLLEGIRAK